MFIGTSRSTRGRVIPLGGRKESTLTSFLKFKISQRLFKAGVLSETLEANHISVDEALQRFVDRLGLPLFIRIVQP